MRDRSIGGSDGRPWPSAVWSNGGRLGTRNMENGMEQDPIQRRFSEGEEQLPDSPQKRHVGRFSEGEEQLPDSPQDNHVGRFSEGQEQLPDSPAKKRVGRFSEGEESSPERRAESP